jgi:hypothetical protein
MWGSYRVYAQARKGGHCIDPGVDISTLGW